MPNDIRWTIYFKYISNPGYFTPDEQTIVEAETEEEAIGKFHKQFSTKRNCEFRILSVEAEEATQDEE